MSADKEVAELKKLVKKEIVLRKAAEEEVNNLRNQVAQLKRSEVCLIQLYVANFSLVFSSPSSPTPYPRL